MPCARSDCDERYRTKSYISVRVSDHSHCFPRFETYLPCIMFLVAKRAFPVDSAKAKSARQGSSIRVDIITWTHSQGSGQGIAQEDGQERVARWEEGHASHTAKVQVVGEKTVRRKHAKEKMAICLVRWSNNLFSPKYSTVIVIGRFLTLPMLRRTSRLGIRAIT